MSKLLSSQLNWVRRQKRFKNEVLSMKKFKRAAPCRPRYRDIARRHTGHTSHPAMLFSAPRGCLWEREAPMDATLSSRPSREPSDPGAPPPTCDSSLTEGWETRGPTEGYGQWSAEVTSLGVVGAPGKASGRGGGALGESRLYSSHAGLHGDEQRHSRTCSRRRRTATGAECSTVMPSRSPGGPHRWGWGYTQAPASRLAYLSQLPLEG